MSYNILIAEIACPNCGEKQQVKIQFKFGNTWQLQYKLGDTITWGGNDIGTSDLGKVKVYGIIESAICIFCKESDIPEEYDIFITNNLIISFSPMGNIHDYLEGNGEYVNLE